MTDDKDLRFYHELAWHMRCTVPELLDRMSAVELTYWSAFIAQRNKEAKQSQR